MGTEDWEEESLPDTSQENGMNLGFLAAGWLAVHDPGLSASPISTSLLTYVMTNGQAGSLVDAWQRLGAFQSIRAFGRRRSLYVSGNTQEETPTLRSGVHYAFSRSGDSHQPDAVVWWHDPHTESATLLGTQVVLFQQVIPQEAQVQMAYDTFRYRFLTWLEQHCQILVLEHTDTTLIFIPDGVTFPDLSEAWQRFIAHAFSASGLQQTFVLLLNSTILSDRGFSVPDVPVVTMEQVDILVALFYATLQAIAQRLKRLERERQALLAFSDGPDSRELTSKEVTTLKNLDERLTKQHGLYDQALMRLKDIFTQLQQADNARAARIRILADSYALTATRQLKVTGAVMDKTVMRIEELLALTPEELFSPPSLLSREPPQGEIRAASDFAKGVCYACGSTIPSPKKKGKQVTYTANKLILQAPSQTLQSHFQQVQPQVCPLCALLALACPIKMVASGLVITLRELHGQQSARYLYEHQLRMFTTGEFNIAAGRYLLIPCTEQAPDTKPLIERLGGKEYALLKVASLFPVDVLMRFQAEVFFGTDPLLLQPRHLQILRFFLEAFSIHLDSFRDKINRQRYAAMADAIRYVEHDMIVFALYRLVVGLQQQSTFSTVQRTLLEDGLVAYKEQLVMDGETQLERRFRDIIGLTGVLSAFISLSRSKLSQPASNGSGAPSLDPKQRDRELKKLLEEVDNPNHFTYEAAGVLPGQSAQLWRSQQNYFAYDEAKRLLQEVAQVEIGERETISEKGEPVLKLYYDDICKMYAVLYERRYLTEKARRDFTYELKLSLYSRFPDLRPGNQNS